jgi:hypothetical protein
MQWNGMLFYVVSKLRPCLISCNYPFHLCRTTRKKAGKRKEKRRKKPSLVDTDEPVAYLSKKMDAAGGKDL